MTKLEIILPAISISFPFFVEKQMPAYIQIGDLLRMLLSGRPELTTCNFCQTVNDGSEKSCAGCGWKLQKSFENSSAISSFSSGFLKEANLSALASNALRVVLVPLLIFAGFGFWFLFHSTARWAPDPLMVPSMVLPREITPSTAHEIEKESVIESAASKYAILGDRSDARKEEEAVGLTEAKAGIIKKSISHPAYKSRPGKLTSSRGMSPAYQGFRKPSPGCGSLNFLARAICINNRCAEPHPAQQLQCRDAVRQRRIDEARRNSL
ncbi:hypothetical protein [Variovorax sp. SRS16]|uniref:hypothetical protein n=1 Tax=Variovorax sp. SRS16 TaxID=282217 RepID=UPI0013A56741|nr:hypothetical protein [Variovorax sp. SRS16]